jgi:hypothetical protein
MKWLAALLMIINVGLYLWVSGEQITVEDVANAPRPDVNKAGMLLFSETSESRQIGSITRNEQATASADNGTQNQQSAAVNEDQGTGSTLQGDEGKAAISAMDESSPLDAQPDLQSENGDDLAMNCFRIGPFKGSNGWSIATQWMKENGIEYRHVTGALQPSG